MTEQRQLVMSHLIACSIGDVGQSCAVAVPWATMACLVSLSRRVSFCGTTLLLCSCDPLMNIEGAFFPAWLVSGVLGIVATALLYVLLDRLKLHQHLLLPPLTYLAFMVISTALIWLVFYG